MKSPIIIVGLWSLLILLLLVKSLKGDESDGIHEPSRSNSPSQDTLADQPNDASILRFVVVQTPRSEPIYFTNERNYPTIWRSSVKLGETENRSDSLDVPQNTGHINLPNEQPQPVYEHYSHPEIHNQHRVINIQSSHANVGNSRLESQIGNPKKEERLPASGNLAAILAGAGSIGSSHQGATKVDNEDPITNSPLYSEDYDKLYDEFVDTYYDTGIAQNNDKSKNERTSQRTTQRTSQRTTQEHTPKHPTSTPYSKVTKEQRLTPTVKSSTSTSSSNKEREDRILSPSFSLSEVLQTMSLSLPQFLGTLKKHGSSLKKFTTKLKSRALSQSDFRRAKGNPEMLFEMINLNDEQSEENQNTTSSSSTKLSQNIPTTTIPPTKTELVSIVTEISSSISTDNKRNPPLFRFGSRPSGVNLAKNITRHESISESPISIKLDIITLPKDKDQKDTNSTLNVTENVNKAVKSTTLKPRLTTVPLRPYRKEPERVRPYRPRGYDHSLWNKERGLINSRLSSTARPTLRPPYKPRPPDEPIIKDEPFGSSIIVVDKSNANSRQFLKESKNIPAIPTNHQKEIKNNNNKRDPESIGVATRSAIMAAGILGGVALTFFIAIFVVVKYRNNAHRNKRRPVLTLPSESSSSSIPPIYATRSCISKEDYKTSGFWNTLKKRFDPYSSPSTSPSSSSYKDAYSIYGLK